MSHHGKYKEATLEEIGEEFGLTRERTRQIQEGALSKLRHRLQVRGVSKHDVADMFPEKVYEPHIRSHQCRDCLTELRNNKFSRCPPCQQYEEARHDGYQQGQFRSDQYMAGVRAILTRWKGTTT